MTTLALSHARCLSVCTCACVLQLCVEVTGGYVKFGTTQNLQQVANPVYAPNNHLSSYVRKHTFWHAPIEDQNQPTHPRIWTESTLFVRRNFASLAIQNAPNEGSDQTVRMRRLIWIFAGRTCLYVRFLALQFTFMIIDFCVNNRIV